MRDISLIDQLVNSHDFIELQNIAIRLNNEKSQFDIIELFADYFNENAWSKIFAYLLHSDLKHNGHQLGQRFFREWIKKIDDKDFKQFINDLPDENISEIKAVIEWRTEENRRIDILIEIFDKSEKKCHSVLGIENKLYSGERPNQLADYQDSISKSFEESKNKFLIFLTPPGREGVTSRENKDCPQINVSYESIRDASIDISKNLYNNQITLLLKSMELHINKMLNKNNMELEIRKYRLCSK